MGIPLIAFAVWGLIFVLWVFQEQYKYLHELALEYMDKYEIYANFK